MTWSFRAVGHAADLEEERAVVEKLKAAVADLELHEARFFGDHHTGDLQTMSVDVPPAPAPEPAPEPENTGTVAEVTTTEAPGA